MAMASVSPIQPIYVVVGWRAVAEIRQESEVRNVALCSFDDFTNTGLQCLSLEPFPFAVLQLNAEPR
jgi:hypothetical protein